MCYYCARNIFTWLPLYQNTKPQICLIKGGAVLKCLFKIDKSDQPPPFLWTGAQGRYLVLTEPQWLSNEGSYHHALSESGFVGPQVSPFLVLACPCSFQVSRCRGMVEMKWKHRELFAMPAFPPNSKSLSSSFFRSDLHRPRCPMRPDICCFCTFLPCVKKLLCSYCDLHLILINNVSVELQNLSVWARLSLQY